MISDRTLEALKRWSVLLDGQFRVPGTRVTFGIDPLVGLIPGLGDLVTPVFTTVLIVHAVRAGLPRRVMGAMALNALIDFAIGLLPVAGDLADIGWKANMRNVALIERHLRP